MVQNVYKAEAFIEAIPFLPKDFSKDSIFRISKNLYPEMKNQIKERLHELGTVTEFDFDSMWDEAYLQNYAGSKWMKEELESLFSNARKYGFIMPASPNETQLYEKIRKYYPNLEEPALFNYNYRLYCIDNRLNLSDKSDQSIIKEAKQIIDCEVHIIHSQREMDYDQKIDKKELLTLNLIGRRSKRKTVKEEATFLSSSLTITNFFLKHAFTAKVDKATSLLLADFILNRQKYSIAKSLYRWGYSSKAYYFRNGVYDLYSKKFHAANGNMIITYKDEDITLVDNNKGFRPPVYPHSDSISKEGFLQFVEDWERINGKYEVRILLSYALLCFLQPKYRSNSDSFPILFLYGPPGTGKSSCGRLIMDMFGYDSNTRLPLNDSQTKKSLERKLSLASGYPVLLDDYRDPKGKNSSFLDLNSKIMQWYHFGGSSRSKEYSNVETEDIPMDACIVITGNDLPSDEATKSRLTIVPLLKRLEGSKADLLRIENSKNHATFFLRYCLEQYLNIEYLFDHYDKITNEKGFNDTRHRMNWNPLLVAYKVLESTLFSDIWEDSSSFEGFLIKVACEKFEDLPLAKLFFEKLEENILSDNCSLFNNGMTITRDFKNEQYTCKMALLTHSGELFDEGKFLNHLTEQRARLNQELEKMEAFLCKTSPRRVGSKNLRCHAFDITKLISDGYLDKEVFYKLQYMY